MIDEFTVPHHYHLLKEYMKIELKAPQCRLDLLLLELFEASMNKNYHEEKRIATIISEEAAPEAFSAIVLGRKIAMTKPDDFFYNLALSLTDDEISMFIPATGEYIKTVFPEEILPEALAEICDAMGGHKAMLYVYILNFPPNPGFPASFIRKIIKNIDLKDFLDKGDYALFKLSKALLNYLTGMADKKSLLDLIIEISGKIKSPHMRIDIAKSVASRLKFKTTQEVYSFSKKVFTEINMNKKKEGEKIYFILEDDNKSGLNDTYALMNFRIVEYYFKKDKTRLNYIIQEANNVTQISEKAQAKLYAVNILQKEDIGALYTADRDGGVFQKQVIDIIYEALDHIKMALYLNEDISSISYLLNHIIFNLALENEEDAINVIKKISDAFSNYDNTGIYYSIMPDIYGSLAVASSTLDLIKSFLAVEIKSLLESAVASSPVKDLSKIYIAYLDFLAENELSHEFNDVFKEYLGHIKNIEISEERLFDLSEKIAFSELFYESTFELLIKTISEISCPPEFKSGIIRNGAMALINRTLDTNI